MGIWQAALEDVARLIAQSVHYSRICVNLRNIAPPTQRDLGGVTVSLMEVRFRLDEDDNRSNTATQVCFGDYSGTPTEYGIGLKSHLAELWRGLP